MRRTRPALAALVLVLAGAMTGCGGSDSDDESSGPSTPRVSATPSPTPSPTPSTYLPVPTGVTLSDQGSTLALGGAASVAWQPRQDTVGVLDVSVDRLEQTTLADSFTGWKIPPETETATPYFVRASVTNRGATDLSGKAVPLYAVDATGTLIEATMFASTFKPCRDGVFPAAFGPGATAQVCLVYFVPAQGSLTAVSFRPTQEFDPITWTGDVVPAEKAAKTRKSKATPTASPTP